MLEGFRSHCEDLNFFSEWGVSSKKILSTVEEWSDFIMRGSLWALWRKQTEAGEQEQGASQETLH